MLLELYLSGEFAYSLEKIRQVGKAREKLPHTQWEDHARSAFGIGDAAKDGG